MTRLCEEVAASGSFDDVGADAAEFLGFARFLEVISILRSDSSRLTRLELDGFLRYAPQVYGAVDVISLMAINWFAAINWFGVNVVLSLRRGLLQPGVIQSISQCAFC